MSKRTLLETLNRDFQGKNFTRFAVVSKAKDWELQSWSEGFLELISNGVLVAVEEKPLGTVYRKTEDKLVMTESEYSEIPNDFDLPEGPLVILQD